MDELFRIPPPPDRELMVLLQNRIGRNVLRYQQIELYLRSALRQLRFIPPSPDAPEDELPRVELQGGTLGSLFTEARKHIDVEEPAAIPVWETFDQVLADRNALIHGFLHVHRKRLETDDGIRSLITRLDAQHARCDLVLQIAESFSASAVLDSIEKARISEAERDALRAGFVAALARAGHHVSIGPIDPVAEQVAAVVKLVRLAEQEHGDAERGTHLSTAGYYVARHFPKLKYKQLGYEGLEDLVTRAGFETWSESTSDTGKKVTKYRSGRSE